jgi:hypothetical protein
MNSNLRSLAFACAGLLAHGTLAHANLTDLAPPGTNQPITWVDLGAQATAQYSGDGLAVFTGAEGAVQFRCAFQKLAGQVTPEGLWLQSTVPGAAANRFRVVADRVGRDSTERSAGIFAGAGELRVELAVDGATVEALAGPDQPDAGSVGRVPARGAGVAKAGDCPSKSVGIR